MKARSRNILFGLVLLVFFISSPLLVLYALGYRYDSNEGRLHKTATIALTFQPGDAEVFLDGDSLGTKNEKVILQGLKGGDHTVQLQKEGYRTWSHEFATTAGAVSFADDVILMKSALSPEAVLVTPFTFNLSNQEEDRLFLVSSVKEDTKLTVVDQSEFRTLQETTIKKIQETLGSTSAISVEDGIWLTGGTWMIFPYTKNDAQFLFGWNTQSNAIYDLAIFSKNADDFFATPQNDVLAIDEDGLTSWMNLSTGETTSPQKTLFRLTRTLRSMTIEKEDSGCFVKEKITPLTESKRVSAISCGAYEGALLGNFVALRNRTTQELSLYDFSSRTLTPLSKTSTHIAWAPEAETPTLFYSDNGELWVYRTVTPLPQLVTRLSTPLTTFQPHAAGNYVSWIQNGELSIAEVGFSDAATTNSWKLDQAVIDLARDVDNSKLLLVTQDDKKQKRVYEVTLY